MQGRTLSPTRQLRQTEDPSLLETILRRLLIEQRADGGWGHSAGHPAATETTALALLTLQAPHIAGSADLPATSGPRRRAGEWLAAQQLEDGGWPVSTQTVGSSWSTSLAVLALAGEPALSAETERGARWLVREKGRGPPWLRRLYDRFFGSETSVNALDPTIVGWPWAHGTFSWVEPTAYAILALRRLPPSLRPRGHENRLDSGRRMLIDRMCYEGGWNYGNKRVLGEDLWPYEDLTALGLLALSDLPFSETHELSLEALARRLEANHSGLAAALSILCYRTYGRPTERLEAWLAESYANTKFLNETRVFALAGLALSGGETLLRRADPEA